MEYKKIFVEKIPVPPITEENQNKANKITTLVEMILTAKAANPNADTCDQEVEIDKLVYSLYGLAQGEISLVENK